MTFEFIIVHQQRENEPILGILRDRLIALYGDTTDVARGIPSGTVGDPGDFGEIVTFLCSEQAKFVTGVALQVDGGSYAGLL